VSALLRGELLKLRTTRARFSYPLVLLLLAGIATAATVGGAVDGERGTASFQSDLPGNALFATLLALILGITIVTAEFRHGTATPTFLVTPVRERVVVAKTVAGALVGALFGLFSVAVVAAVAVPWLLALGHAVHAGEGDVWVHALQVVLAAAAWGALGAAVGAVVHSQIAGIVGAVIWLLIVENLLVAVLGLVDWDGIGDYLPGSAINGVGGDPGGGLTFWPALAVTLGYVVAVGAVGAWRTGRRDIT
jgi:ABC-2 type transport system permease protein